MRQDGTAGNLHFHLFACVFSQAKKVSELLEEGYSPGMFEVADDNQFFKGSDKAEELELCRVILYGLPKLFCTSALAGLATQVAKTSLWALLEGRIIYWMN